MRKLILPLIIGTALSLSAPALAKIKRGFHSTVTAPVTTSLRLDISVSDDLAHRAENLPKKLRDRSSSSRSRSGFANNGFYGEREIDRLQTRLEKKITQRFALKGITIDPDASTVLKITLVDARPNRPTFNQLSREPSLSFKSFGLGGAELTGEIIQPGGVSLGDISYSFFEDDIRDAAFGSTWSDANRAFDRFARKAAKTLSAN